MKPEHILPVEGAPIYTSLRAVTDWERKPITLSYPAYTPPNQIQEAGRHLHRWLNPDLNTNRRYGMELLLPLTYGDVLKERVFIAYNFISEFDLTDQRKPRFIRLTDGLPPMQYNRHQKSYEIHAPGYPPTLVYNMLRVIHTKEFDDTAPVGTSFVVFFDPSDLKIVRVMSDDIIRFQSWPPQTASIETQYGKDPHTWFDFSGLMGITLTHTIQHAQRDTVDNVSYALPYINEFHAKFLNP